MQLPTQALIRVISRIKVMGELDIADRIRPQDGRARIRVDDSAYDLRISTVPSRNSEKAVIRILDPGKASGGLDDVNIPEPERSQLRRVCRNPDGIVIVTGPTGSGKTTTLYALLQELATDQVNIMTVEDPIEYRLHGITQIQVETKRGVTFASTLRAILRQDPDIIFVGEIRDLETAEIAVQASMTGHLVLATLHTNDAPGAVQRLMDLGLDGPSIAGSLRAVLGQRLLRSTCGSCNGLGCEVCGLTGYKGRRPVVELMVVNDELTSLVAQEATYPELRRTALDAGMRTLFTVGTELVAQGVTDADELGRVLGDDTEESARPPASGEVEAEPLTANEEPEEDRSSKVADGPAEWLTPIGSFNASVPDAPSPEANAHPVDHPADAIAPPSHDPWGFETTLPIDTTPVAPSPPAPKTTSSGDIPSILLVDDDPVSRTLARSLLESSGAQVTEAADGMGAVQALAAGMQFDLCILDLNMPNMGGREVLRRMRADADTAELPVIVLTGDDDQEAEIELMQAGADDYLRKPLDAGRFMVRVKATLRRSRRGLHFGGAA